MKSCSYLDEQGVARHMASSMELTTLDGVGSSHFKSSLSKQCLLVPGMVNNTLHFCFLGRDLKPVYSVVTNTRHGSKKTLELF